MDVEYTVCPYCHTKDIKTERRGARMVVVCNNTEECGNVIDSYPAEEAK